MFLFLTFAIIFLLKIIKICSCFLKLQQDKCVKILTVVAYFWGLVPALPHFKSNE